jgi:hypothetical protein
MLSLSTIRTDLKDIRYYYLRKEMFEEAGALTGRMNEIVITVNKYNKTMQKASPRLYDLYFNLYIKNHTQESLSDILGFTPEYIQRLNKRLLKFLQANICEA